MTAAKKVVIFDQQLVQDVTTDVRTIFGSVDDWPSDWEDWLPEEVAEAICRVGVAFGSDGCAEKLDQILQARREQEERQRGFEERQRKYQEIREAERQRREAEWPMIARHLIALTDSLGSRHSESPGRVVFRP